ncbi:MAG: phage tail assembly chaperone [Sulfuricella denitrificans]|nr:phage tail assembly chaperone [Sulfuricella denitrificans]
MFKLTPKPTFWAKVEISIPGQTKPASIEVEFKHLGRDGFKAFFEGLEGKTDAEALGDVVVGWKGVEDEFNMENFELLLNNYPTAPMAFFETFRKESLEAKTKN